MEQMMKTSKYKYALGTIGIGLIGSALWSFLYDYVFPACTRFFIQTSSTFSNIVFVNISSHDLVAIHQSIYFSVTLIIVVASILLFIDRYIKIITIENDLKSDYAVLQDQSSSEREIHETDVYLDNLKSLEKIQKLNIRINLFLKFAFPVALIFLIATTIYSFSTTKFIYDSITYFDYLLYVNAENLDDKTERKYKSEFTQIRNSQDYHKLIVELENLAFTNELSVYPNSSIRSREELEKDHPGLKAKRVK